MKAEGKPDFVIEVTDEEVEREKKKVNRGQSKGLLSHWQFTENCVKKILDRNCVLFIALLLLWMEKHTVYGCKRNRKIHAYKDVETAFRRQGSDG